MNFEIRNPLSGEQWWVNADSIEDAKDYGLSLPKLPKNFNYEIKEDEE